MQLTTAKIKTTIASISATAAALMSTAQAQAIDITVRTNDTGFFGSASSLINSILRFVFAIAALLVFFYLIWGGIDWITSGGDKGKTETARNKITSAIIGLIVLAAAYAILQIVLTFLGYSSINDVFQKAVVVN